MSTQLLPRVRSLFSWTYGAIGSQKVTQSVASGFAMRSRAAAVLTLSVIAMAEALFPARAQNVARHPKIRGDIYHHEQLKARPPGRAIGAHRQFVYGRGLNGDDFDREAVAIYVHERLTRAEIEVLRAQGIEIDSDLWIPPIPGHHPLGFHLGVARYASLPILANDARIVRVDSAEIQSRPLNDVGGRLIHVDTVHAGTGPGEPRNGTGVRIAIADSGVDLTHPDLSPPAEAFDVTDGVGVANWRTDVANSVTDHGTHVTGTVLGNGSLSGGRFVGAAPAATWAFYKIGNDFTARAAIADMVEAINRATTLRFDIFTMSFGGNEFFMDGSGPMEQAIDNAVANGVTVFISAGNAASESQHASMNVALGTLSGTFGFLLNNGAGTGPLTTAEGIQVIWRDDQSGNANITLTCNNLAAGESLNLISSQTSSRGTDARQYWLTPNIAAGTMKTYDLQLRNSATAGATPLVHCYAWNTGTFTAPDSSFTVESPALADGAIAVGAWVHRTAWTDFTGVNNNSTSEALGTLATFSSLGPRMDGVRKPELLAPGSMTISLLDGNNANLTTPVANYLIIDNDGINRNGTGPANYAVSQGTSMACPMAAGVAALVLEENPFLTPAQVRDALTRTASSAGSPNNSVGFGLIDALAAVRESRIVWVDFNFSCTSCGQGTFDDPYNSLFRGVLTVPDRGTIAIKAGSSSETITIRNACTLRAHGGPVIIGQ